MAKEYYRGKTKIIKNLYSNGQSQMIIVPSIYLKFLGIDKKVAVSLDTYNKRIIIEKAEVENV